MDSGRYEIREGSIEELLLAQAAVPELLGGRPVHDLYARLEGQPHLILLAWAGSEIAGFKVGYEINNQTFYTWLGGVHPAHRRQGIAQALATRQEDWAKKQGYHEIRLKTRNSFPAMLQFAIGSGFQITELDTREQRSAHRIILHKTLTP